MILIKCRQCGHPARSHDFNCKWIDCSCTLSQDQVYGEHFLDQEKSTRSQLDKALEALGKLQAWDPDQDGDLLPFTIRITTQAISEISCMQLDQARSRL